MTAAALPPATARQCERKTVPLASHLVRRTTPAPTEDLPSTQTCGLRR